MPLGDSWRPVCDRWFDEVVFVEGRKVLAITMSTLYYADVRKFCRDTLEFPDDPKKAGFLAKYRGVPLRASRGMTPGEVELYCDTGLLVLKCPEFDVAAVEWLVILTLRQYRPPGNQLGIW